MFNPAETTACQQLLDMALYEDMGPVGDVTSLALIPHDLQGGGVFVARGAGVVAGLPVLALVFGGLDRKIHTELLCQDGDRVPAGTALARVRGPMRALLTGERTALNFLQRLSGIATRTREFVDAIAGTSASILDTRKTTPGWRLLEKYAVRQGGGCNHRLGLYDGLLIKDNHLAALGDIPNAITVAVRRARLHTTLPLELEIDRLDQLDEALACAPDIILLDNMSPAQLRTAVARRNAVAPRVQLEASGGITLERVRVIAETGVERISVGSLTHSAPALDIALDYEA